MIYGRPIQDRQSLLRDAGREVAHQADLARRDLARSARAPIAYVAGPSSIDLARATQRAVPGQSALVVAAATMRHVHVRLNPADMPDSHAFAEDGAVTVWSRGRVLPAGTLAGSKVNRSHRRLMIAGGGLNRLVEIDESSVTDARGRPVPPGSFAAWVDAMSAQGRTGE